ncbi:MAG: sugar transferase [Gemmatimonadales bacterium]|nr:sugar transferase [Gemmatimonadales bacterium]
MTATPRTTELLHRREAGRERAARVTTAADALPQGKDGAARVLNVLVAATGLVVLSPVFLGVALAVRLTSRGPVVYTQTRVGMDRRRRQAGTGACRRVQDLGGRPFTIYKFRTMTVDAEQQSGAVWAKQADPRVTSIGKFLRKTRLDELPQLVNVLQGDMDIVGPRPERPSIFADLRTKIEHYPLRQRLRPGITGLAQISQAYDSCLDDVRNKVDYDLQYIRKAGFWEDLRIMALTLPVMIFRKGGW